MDSTGPTATSGCYRYCPQHRDHGLHIACVHVTGDLYGAFMDYQYWRLLSKAFITILHYGTRIAFQVGGFRLYIVAT